MRPEQEDQPYFVTSSCLSLREDCQEMWNQQKKKKRWKISSENYALFSVQSPGFFILAFTDFEL